MKGVEGMKIWAYLNEMLIILNYKHSIIYHDKWHFNFI